MGKAPKTGQRERSSLWYYLPIFFWIIGGVIAYIKIKNDDTIKARNCIILGIIITIPSAIGLGSFIFFGENPFYVVSSGGMVPELQVYDVLVVQGNESFENVQNGDIIVFHRPAGHDRVIVHRVAEIIDDDPKTIRTKGDANPSSIPGTDFPITEDEYIGKVAYVIPQIGYITRILMPPITYIVILIVILLPIIPIIQHVVHNKATRNILTTKPDDTMFYGCPRCGNNTQVVSGRQYCSRCRIYL